MLQGLLADEISAGIQYVEYSAMSDNSDHVELHRALMEIHDDFPTWLQHRTDFLADIPVKYSSRE